MSGTINRALRRKLASEYRRKRGWEEMRDVSKEVIPKLSTPPPDTLIAYWISRHFTVQEHRKHCRWGTITLLFITKNDQTPVTRWADVQNIKTDICGPDSVAIEVYPSEEEMPEMAGYKQIFVLPEGFELPFKLGQ